MLSKGAFYGMLIFAIYTNDCCIAAEGKIEKNTSIYINRREFDSQRSNLKQI